MNKIVFSNNFPYRNRNSNKFDNGRVLFFSGSEGMAGACILNIIGANSVGIGYCHVLLPESIYPIVGSNQIDCIYHVDKLNRSDYINELNLYEKVDAISVGSGLNNHPFAKEYFKHILDNFKGPIIVDAYGLTMLSEDEDLYKLNQNLILTPHMGEFSRLCKLSVEDINKDKVNIATNFAVKNHVILVLKGPQTLVVSKDGQVFINETGNEVLARAGSGDVLNGMICGMCARYKNTLDAVKDGVWLHGHIADMYVKDHSKEILNFNIYPEYADKFLRN